LKEVKLHLLVAVLAGPEIEGDGGEFVDDRVGEAGFGEVDGLEVLPAVVAAVDANVGKLVGGINRELLMIFFAAVGADDAAEFPFSQAEGTDEAALATIAEGTQNGDSGLAPAERAEGTGVSVGGRFGTHTGECGVGLKESAGEEFVRGGSGVRRVVGGGARAVPEIVEEFGLDFGGCGAKLARSSGEIGRAVLFDDREERWEAGEERGEFRRSGDDRRIVRWMFVSA
jgi:hypothetical protein